MERDVESSRYDGEGTVEIGQSCQHKKVGATFNGVRFQVNSAHHCVKHGDLP